jgi:hypothetical protein
LGKQLKSEKQKNDGQKGQPNVETPLAANFGED